MGDSLMTTPAIRAYHDGLPDTDEIIVLTGGDEWSSLFLENPSIDRVYSLEEKELKYYKKLLAGDSVHPVEIQDSVCMGADLSASTAYSRASRTRQKFVRFPDGISRPVVVSGTMVNGFAAILNTTIHLPHYELNLTDEETEWGRVHVGEKPVVVCAALSSSCASRDPKIPGLPPNKMQTASFWNQLIKSFPEYEFRFVKAAAEKPLKINAKWESGVPIRLVAGLCKAAKCVVSVDTGIGHLAAAVGAPLISIPATTIDPEMVRPPTRYGEDWKVKLINVREGNTPLPESAKLEQVIEILRNMK